MVKQKIALGTVQLGMAYGINNNTGKPDKQEAFRILNTAFDNGITMLDSAEAYGNSIQVIGSYVKERADRSIKIISKFIADETSVNKKITESLKNLGCQHLYAYMYHRFSDYNSKKCWNELLKLKQERKMERIGVSLYSLKELEQAIKDSEIDLIQIPLNPFDCSNDKKKLLTKAKLLGKEIHVRSVFFQGLFFKQPHELPANLQEFAEPLRQFHQVLLNHNMSAREACLNYALHQPSVDYVLIGVETHQQLVENLDSVLEVFPTEISSKLESIIIPNPALLNPSNWNA
jgi:aryl-alcohol dehydrogenase-like predicted oxidoreductase